MLSMHSTSLLTPVTEKYCPKAIASYIVQNFPSLYPGKYSMINVPNIHHGQMTACSNRRELTPTKIVVNSPLRKVTV